MEQSENLYQPSLESTYKETKSYDIEKFLLIAFFGGVIPVMVLGTKNAKWLHAPQKIINLLITLGVGLLSAKLVLLAMYLNGILGFDESYLKIGYKVGSVLFFLLFKFMLGKLYHQHVTTGGDVEPLLKPALTWMVMGMLIEGALIFFVTTAFI